MCIAVALAALCARSQPPNGGMGQLVVEVQRTIAALSSTTGIAALDPAVERALDRVPRAAFVPEAWREHASEDRALPIGQGQTISQPTIVALMTQLADLGPDSVVLEVGTGSGYQAAVLAEVAGKVYTIEIVPELGERARTTLEELGYDTISLRIGDGYQGWPEAAPFDAIIVTAAPEEIPPPLLEQLKPGGRLVVPIGRQDDAQVLRVIEKSRRGELLSRDVLPVAFVPFTRSE